MWSGIADRDKAQQVATRLLSPELFSGWGIRTMGSGEGGFNPISHHNGSVWPHDTALIAAGLAQYGFVEEAARVIAALLDAAERFPSYRLPELFAGFDRLETGFPVDYPTSSSPHAWAAGSVLPLIGIMLGLEPAPATGSQQIMARPVLPPGIGRLRVAGLRLNGTALDLELRRVGGDVRLDVLRSPAGISVQRAA